MFLPELEFGPAPAPAAAARPKSSGTCLEWYKLPDGIEKLIRETSLFDRSSRIPQKQRIFPPKSKNVSLLRNPPNYRKTKKTMKPQKAKIPRKIPSLTITNLSPVSLLIKTAK
jgi:hypothetical protein